MKEYKLNQIKLIIEEIMIPLLLMLICRLNIISDDLLPYVKLIIYICLNDTPNLKS